MGGAGRKEVGLAVSAPPASSVRPAARNESHIKAHPSDLFPGTLITQKLRAACAGCISLRGEPPQLLGYPRSPEDDPPWQAALLPEKIMFFFNKT